MESKINEIIDGVMLQIKTYGIKGPTVKLYQNVCNTIVKYEIVTGDDHYSEQLVESTKYWITSVDSTQKELDAVIRHFFRRKKYSRQGYF